MGVKGRFTATKNWLDYSTDAIRESIELIMNSGKGYEFGLPSSNPILRTRYPRLRKRCLVPSSMWWLLSHGTTALASTRTQELDRQQKNAANILTGYVKKAIVRGEANYPRKTTRKTFHRFRTQMACDMPFCGGIGGFGSDESDGSAESDGSGGSDRSDRSDGSDGSDGVGDGRSDRSDGSDRSETSGWLGHRGGWRAPGWLGAPGWWRHRGARTQACHRQVVENGAFLIGRVGRF